MQTYSALLENPHWCISAPVEVSVSMKGQTQKEQQLIVEQFRRNQIDVLVATCIGEEGLDIGSVVRVFDLAEISPCTMTTRI